MKKTLKMARTCSPRASLLYLLIHLGLLDNLWGDTLRRVLKTTASIYFRYLFFSILLASMDNLAVGFLYEYSRRHCTPISEVHLWSLWSTETLRNKCLGTVLSNWGMGMRYANLYDLHVDMMLSDKFRHVRQLLHLLGIKSAWHY